MRRLGMMIAGVCAAGLAWALADGAAARPRIERTGGAPVGAASQRNGAARHTAWIEQSLREMQIIRPGTTRAALLKVFTEEGGLSTPKQQTFVYRECPYIKVDVQFRIVGRPERDADGRLASVRSARDIITSISRPYLAWSVAD